MRSWSCDMRYSGPSNLHVWDLLQIHTNGTDNIFLFSKVCTLLPFFVIWESWILILTFYSGCLIYSIILQISASSEVSDKPVVVLITWSCCASDWLNFSLTHLAFPRLDLFGRALSYWIRGELLKWPSSRCCANIMHESSKATVWFVLRVMYV